MENQDLEAALSNLLTEAKNLSVKEVREVFKSTFNTAPSGQPMLLLTDQKIRKPRKSKYHYKDTYTTYHFTCKLCSCAWSERHKVEVLSPWHPTPGEYSIPLETCPNCTASLSLMSKNEIITFVTEHLRKR
jgi:hypothetical protein